MRGTIWSTVAACCVVVMGCGGGGGGNSGSDSAADPGPGDVVTPPDGETGNDVSPDALDMGEATGEAGLDPGPQDVVTPADANEVTAEEVSACGEECSVTNEHGTCKGWRPCVDGGLGECDARTPEAEVCDGVDNDCDGKTDEEVQCDDGDACTKNDRCDVQKGQCVGEPYTCDDGKWCTVDQCLGDGTCDFQTIQAGSCLIDGACYHGGDASPANSCYWCDDEKDNTTWTLKKDGEACSDGDECTIDDRCLNAVCIPGTPRSCNDGNPCTTDSCDPKTGCVQKPNDLYREDFDGEVEFTFENSDAVVGWHVVNEIPEYPSSLLYYGDPKVWSYDTPGRANEGVAISKKWIQVSPGQPAFLSFDLYLDNEWSNQWSTGGEGRMENDILEVFCRIEGIGDYLVWTSVSGLPQWWATTPSGTPIAAIPVRISGVDLTQVLKWVGYPPFRLGFMFRTGDHRMNGFRGVHVDNIAIGISCDDGNACTSGDSCQAGLCKGMEVSCNDANDCTLDKCNSTSGCIHSPVNEQGFCDDHDLCTKNTVCSKGSCSGGIPISCAVDGNDCTSDACHPLKGCAYEPIPDFAECSSAVPYGTCLSGTCTPWETLHYMTTFGEFITAFLGVERVEGGPLSIVGFADPRNGETQEDWISPLVVDMDKVEGYWSPWMTPGTFWNLSHGLAVGYQWDPDEANYVPMTAMWDAKAGLWTFAPERNPKHVPASSVAGVLAATRSRWSNEYFLGGTGESDLFSTYLERCTFNPMTGLWIPCEWMVALLDAEICKQPFFMEIYGMWAMSDWAVWAAGVSMDEDGQKYYTILFYDGNELTECDDLKGFRGAFVLDPFRGLLEPAAQGSGSFTSLHGQAYNNIWAVGTHGVVFGFFGSSPQWQKVDPAQDGIAWGPDHHAWGVFVEGRDVHIVGSINDQIPFYLHARRTDSSSKPWVFDRKIELTDFASTQAGLFGVTRDPVTNAIEAVGMVEDPVSNGVVGLRIRLAPPK